jgi:parallel beta-helix repeat protein
MSMKNVIIWVSILVTTTRLFATDYYLSNDGNDNNNGITPATAWKTLAKLSAELGGPSGTWGTISNGDRIYFRKGDTFRGAIAFAAFNNNGITFDAYGSGAMPLIKGSQLVTGWTVHSGNIWKATVAERVYFLYDGGALQTLSRAPNTGTWNLSAATATSLTSSSIGSSGKNFVGANVCVREYDWRLNRQVVTTQSGNTVNWATSIETAGTNANFYFDNKLELLDTEGEWFYDAASQTLYYMSSTNPNSLVMEASVHLLGIAGNDNRSDNTIQNLRFEHYAQEGIRLMGAANNNVIQNCAFNHNFQGVFVSGSNNNIQNNSTTDSYYQGVVLANMGNSMFANNTITNAGMTFGQHRPNFTGDFYSGGLWLINGNAGVTIAYNTITNCGNMGIRFNGNGVVIEYNQIENVMVNMDDGGGIYTWGGDNSSYNNIIRNNIIKNLVGNHNGSAPGNIINGIYIDNFAYNITVEKNTTYDIPNGSGIIINAGAYNCSITGNLTYKCKQGLGFYDWQAGQSVYNNSASGNTFYANAQGAIPIEIASNDNNHNVMSVCDSNFLCNPYASSVGRYLWTNAQVFTMAQWRTTTGYDLASVGSYYNWTWSTDKSFLVVNNTNAAVTYSYSNVVDLNNASVTSLTLQPFDSKVLINSTPLPLTYLAPLQGRAVPTTGIELKWSTASELNTDRFEIERSSDGFSFEKIGERTAKGNSSLPVNYHFWDKKPLSGQNYYRLRQVDSDEKITLSNIVPVGWESYDLIVYPNPVTDDFEIKFDPGWERAVLRNGPGLLLQTFFYPEKTSLHERPPGTYFLEVFTAKNAAPVVVVVLKQ